MTAKKQLHEWRITYRRVGWSTGTSNKTRAFSRHRDALRFYRKLLGSDRPELSPAVIEVHRRPVGNWERVK